MEVDADFIGVVKKNTKGLYKDTIEKLTKDWPGGSYLMLRINLMIPGGLQLIFIGYNYNKLKVLYFIVRDNAGITKTGIPYLSEYPNQFTNFSFRPVARPLVM